MSSGRRGWFLGGVDRDSPSVIRPKRIGLIRGLWGISSSLVSYVGLPALEAESTGGDAEPASTGGDGGTDAAGVECSLQKTAFVMWVGWWEHKATKRTVFQQIRLLRNERLLRQHIVRWVEGCECPTLPSPRTTPPASKVPRTPASKVWGTPAPGLEIPAANDWLADLKTASPTSTPERASARKVLPEALLFALQLRESCRSCDHYQKLQEVFASSLMCRL